MLNIRSTTCCVPIPDHLRPVERNLLRPFSGEYTDGVTPVPFPNTAVKPIRPMIVPLARKSVIAGSSTNRPVQFPKNWPGRFFVALKVLTEWNREAEMVGAVNTMKLKPRFPRHSTQIGMRRKRTDRLLELF